MVKIPINSSQIEIILKLIWKFNGTRITKTVLKKKCRVGGISPLDFKTYYTATGIKTVVLVEVSYIEEWNRI